MRASVPARGGATVALADRLRRFQSAVPGVYAWALTVAPAGFARGASSAAEVAVGIAFLALLLPILAPASKRASASIVALWLFVVASVVAWAISHAHLTPAKLDPTRAVLGALGWLLFALAQAAPPLSRAPGTTSVPIGDGPSSSPRRIFDAVALGIAALGSFALFAIGWRVEVAERAVLVRLVLAASAIGLVATATELCLIHRERRRPRSTQTRLRRATPFLVLLAVLLVSGVAIRATFAR